MPEEKQPGMESLSSILAEPAILIWGRAMADSKLFREQLAHLPSAEEDYNGTLQVLNSAVRRLQIQVRDLIEMHERSLDRQLAAPSPPPGQPARKPVKLARPAASRVSVRERVMNIIRSSENDALTAGDILDQMRRIGVVSDQDSLSNLLQAMRADGMLKLTSTGFWMVA